MLKKNYVVLFFIFFVFGLYASEISDKDKKQENKNVYSVELPKQVELGDFFSVKFSADNKIEKAWITIFNPEKKEVQKINAFSVNDEHKEMAAVAVAAVWWKLGKWEIKTSAVINGALFEETHFCNIAEKKFEEFVMHLNAKNTEIIHKKSPEKTKQSDKLNSILKMRNMESVFFKGPFKLPFAANRISSGFGEKRTSKFSNGKVSESRHWGIDYPAPVGTKIAAPGKGKIVLAEKRIVTGWTIVIEHLPGVYTLYYHLNKIYVKEGSFTEKGTPIGEIGTTGFSTGPHLHWELRINEIPADPNLLLTKPLY